MALVRSTRGAMSPLLLRPGLRAMVAPPAALLAQTEKNAAAYEKRAHELSIAQTGPSPTRSIRRRVNEEATQVRRKYLLEVAAKQAERSQSNEARTLALAKQAEDRAAVRELAKAERRRQFEERERLRLAAKTDVVSVKTERRTQREEILQRRRAHVLADLDNSQPTLPTRENVDAKLREFMGRKMTYDRGLFPE